MKTPTLPSDELFEPTDTVVLPENEKPTENEESKETPTERPRQTPFLT